jgi:hypothetical protein
MWSSGYDVKFGLPAVASKEALSGFIAEANGEVVALGAAWGCTQTKSLIPADHAVEEFFPLHVIHIAAGDWREMPAHQVAKLTAVAKAAILPQMIGPHCATRDQCGKVKLERRALRRGTHQQFTEAKFVIGNR